MLILNSCSGNPVAYGTWFDDQSYKTAAFELMPAQCIRIVAITEAGNRGQWSSAGEINVYGAAANQYKKPNPTLGLWGPTIDFPIVPVSGAIEPDTGNLQTWSSYAKDTFGASLQQTLTSLYRPSTKIVTQRTITNTRHDFFCSGISVDATGRVIITGGDSSTKTSIYVGGSDNWSAGPDMNRGRGYQSQVTLGDNRIFLIGGSWSGGSSNNKNGEIYDPKTNRWTKVDACSVKPMLTADTQNGYYRQDNHGWLFNWKNGYVLQAGPSKKMNWYNMIGAGGTHGAGNRANDADAMCGCAVMYDATAGKVLTIGGSPNYQGKDSTTAAHILTLPGTGGKHHCQCHSVTP
jgi:galactose oxidase